MRVISSFEVYTFNMILLLGMALSIVDLCAGSRRSLMVRQPLSTSVNATVKNCSIPLQKNPDHVQISLWAGDKTIPCNKTPCILEPGNSYNFQISFTTDRPVHNGSLAIDLYHGLKWNHVNTPEISLCRSISVYHCPLKAGQHVVFYTSSKFASAGNSRLSNTPMRYSMRDGRGELLFCFILTVRMNWQD